MEISTLDLPGIPKLRSGKVREVFDLGADGFLLVATDRLSAFDCILPDPIPHKGRVLTQLSAFWFHHLRAHGGIADHLVTADFAEFPERLRPFEAQLAGRSMIVQRARPLPVECIVRGYLAGSGWKEYQRNGQRVRPGLAARFAAGRPVAGTDLHPRQQGRKRARRKHRLARVSSRWWATRRWPWRCARRVC